MDIKKEKIDTVRKPVSSTQKPNPISNVQTWNQEKRKMIDKIASLQTENQRILLNLKAKETECAAQSSKNANMHQALVDQVRSLSNENNSLQTQLLSAKTESSAAKQTISNLKLEKQKLNAVIKQLKTRSLPSTENNKRDDSVNDDGFYEVEKLLKHKYTKGGIQYLVRWKNYSAKDDTWQTESDFVPRFLNEYKRKMKLNQK